MSRWISIEKISNQSKYKEPLKNEKSKDYCKADSEQRVLFFHEQYFGLPYQPFSGLHPDVTELMKHNITDIDGERRNKNCIKGISGHDVQHRKLEKKKLIRIWITRIRHGGLGHLVQESWPYQFIKCDSPALREALPG